MNKRHFSIHSTAMEVISTGSIYVFDIDGTIANVQHRLPHILGKPKGERDWNRFFSDAVLDTPIEWVIDLMHRLPQERIVLITGRSDVIADITGMWLAKHKVPYAELRMRAQGHKAPDYVVKLEMADDYRGRIEFVVEDRQSVVDMWRDNGINVLQCAKWDEE